MSVPEYRDVTKDNHDHVTGVEQNAHNASPQIGVIRNNDPALDIAREHHHGHLHHSAAAVKGLENEVSYTKGTTDEPSTIPRADAMDNALHRRHKVEESGYASKMMEVQDEEKGTMSHTPSEEDPRHHGLSNWYSRFRVFVHIFIFMLFTG